MGGNKYGATFYTSIGNGDGIAVSRIKEILDSWEGVDNYDILSNFTEVTIEATLNSRFQEASLAKHLDGVFGTVGNGNIFLGSVKH